MVMVVPWVKEQNLLNQNVKWYQEKWNILFIYLFKSLFTVGIQKQPKLINSNKKMYIYWITLTIK